MRRITLSVILLPFLVLALVESARGDEETPTFSAPFCGVRAIYTAMRIEGIDVDFRSLLTAEVVSTKSGSTFADLENAVRTHGASAQVMENVSFDDLIRIRQPAILHVRSEVDSPQFDHFVLCIATGENQLELYDAPGAYRITEGELAALWDGSAMFVSRSPIDLTKATWASAPKLLCNALLVGVLFGALAFVRSLKLLEFPRLGRWRLTAQTTIVFASAVALAAGFHLIAQQGLLRQAKIAVLLARSQSVDRAPHIDLAESRRRIDKGAVVIDARDTADFAVAHLPGALNIPPDAPKQFREDLLRDVPVSAPIVVYCAGPECPRAPILANRLIRDGFTHVAVFTGGWAQWNQRPISETASAQEVP